MSLFRRSPEAIVAAAMLDGDREYAGFSEVAVMTGIRNRHGFLLSQVERYGKPGDREIWQKLIRMFGALAVRMLEIWLRSLIQSPSPVPIPGPMGQADDALPDDATREIA